MPECFYSYVILGGGLAGAAAVEGIRQGFLSRSRAPTRETADAYRHRNRGPPSILLPTRSPSRFDEAFSAWICNHN